MASYVYADLVALKRHNDKRLLVQLTNDDDQVDPTDSGATDADAGLIDEEVLSAAEAEAATTIDNHLRNVYDRLPLAGSDLTPEIRLIAAKLTACNLWERRGDEPEQVTLLRKRLLERLKAMGSPKPDENRDQAKSEKAMPVRFQGGKARTAFDQSGYFDGLPSQGTRELPNGDGMD